MFRKWFHVNFENASSVFRLFLGTFQFNDVNFSRETLENQTVYLDKTSNEHFSNRIFGKSIFQRHCKWKNNVAGAMTIPNKHISKQHSLGFEVILIGFEYLIDKFVRKLPENHGSRVYTQLFIYKCISIFHLHNFEAVFNSAPKINITFSSSCHANATVYIYHCQQLDQVFYWFGLKISEYEYIICFMCSKISSKLSFVDSINNNQITTGRNMTRIRLNFQNGWTDVSFIHSQVKTNCFAV